ncbi:hypothetical protein PHMEG_00035951 [Phytophthora megakarya]|uniref:Uncharacterized protein n=1 Tax=Phytophthora megakarya TaxID=4795 RepID=A0A225UM82_9STRA|nr:hypothetical protein PHMEG_00035951 [Phytophthora megakarya]
MLRIIRSPAFQRQLLACGISTSRTLFMALQTVKSPLTIPLIKHNSTLASLNEAATKAQLGLEGSLEEVASSHFSESSAFPEFSPMEDTLLSETVPRIKAKVPVMDAHSFAQSELNEEMQQHFCASSDFPEYSAAEEEAMIYKE